MPRTPSIRYFDSRQAYYTQYQGRQRLLAAGPKDEPDGPTYKKAVERFARIMHLGVEERAEDTCLVSEAIARYYHHLDTGGKKTSLHLARTLLDPAIANFGPLRVCDLKPFVVNDWLAVMANRKPRGRTRPWNGSTRATAVRTLIRVFNWGREQGFLKNNPVAGMKKAEARARGKEVMLPGPLEEMLIALANPQLAKLLRFLRATGARPGEAMHAEAKHYRAGLKAIVFPWNPPPGEYRWKTAAKIKRDRVIYLTGELAEVVQGEVTARGKGRIFVTRSGKPWKHANLVNCVNRLADRDEVKKWCSKNDFNPGNIMCYSFRHGYITRMLAKGCPIKVLADLCGTSVAVIESTYSHAHDDLAAMRRMFDQFSGGSSSPPRP
jgi:integrase